MDNREMESLVLRIPNGDLEALEGLYREFHHAVHSYSLLILRDRATADDNAQDVFLQVWAKAATYRPGGNPRAWILRIARNLAIDRIRKSAREIGVDEVPEESLPAEDRTESRTADRLDLLGALDILEPRDRQVVLLRAVAELPLKEVARLSGLPVSTVHWRYRRSLRRLAEQLGEPEGFRERA